MESISQKVTGADGAEVGSIELDPIVFDSFISEDLVHATVRWQLSKRRAGTHSVLTRTMMKGGAKKPWKQKGTGRARAGSSISPHWVGGAVVHGPQPRDYTTRVTKRARRQALVSVLSNKRAAGKLIIVDSFPITEERRTKSFVAFLKTIGLEDRSALLILDEGNKALELASRNVAKVLPISVEGVNVYDLLRHDYLVMTKEGLQRLQERIRCVCCAENEGSESNETAAA